MHDDAKAGTPPASKPRKGAVDGAAPSAGPSFGAFVRKPARASAAGAATAVAAAPKAAAEGLRPETEASFPADAVEVGAVVDAYGLKGWVKVAPHAQGGGALLSAKRWWLVKGRERQSSAQLAAKLHGGDSVVGQLAGVADVATARAHRLSNRTLSTVTLTPAWVDATTLVAPLVPATRGAMPVEPTVPSGPVVQENLSGKNPARTYPDLLASAYDESLFDHFATADLALVSLDGAVTPLGLEGLFDEASPSPDPNAVPSGDPNALPEASIDPNAPAAVETPTDEGTPLDEPLPTQPPAQVPVVPQPEPTAVGGADPPPLPLPSSPDDIP